MRKYINFILIATPVILLAALTIALGVIRSTLPEVTVRIKGYDPRDLLSGHYISYSIDWENTDCSQFKDNICPEYEFYNISEGSGVWIDNTWATGFRFYIPEKNAEELDLLFRSTEGNTNVFEVVYSYAPGFLPMAKKLLINGNDWRASMKEPIVTEKNNSETDDVSLQEMEAYLKKQAEIAVSDIDD